MIFQVGWKWGGNGGVEVVLSGVDVDFLFPFWLLFLRNNSAVKWNFFTGT